MNYFKLRRKTLPEIDNLRLQKINEQTNATRWICSLNQLSYRISIDDLIGADIAAAAVLISMGALLGR